MKSNSGQRSAARGLLPLGILTALLAIILAAYLNLAPQTVGSELSTSTSGEESAADASLEEALVSTIPEDSAALESSNDDSDSADSTDTDNDPEADSPEEADDTAANDDDAETEAETEAESQSETTEADTDSAEEDADTSDASASVENADDSDVSSDNEGSGAADAPNKPDADTVVGTYQGMPVGYTADGLVFRGEPDAPVTIYEYSDYQCPFCLRHFSQTETALNEAYVETGKAKFVFVDFPLVQIHPNAPAASSAALCVAEQDPVAFWEMHALIFETQNQWSNSPEPVAFFQELGAPLEIDQDAFASCLDSGRTEAMVERTYAMGRSLGYSGTPSFQFVMDGSDETYDLIGAQPYEKFSSWIDAMAVGEVPADAVAQPDEATAQGAGNQELPYWATEEGLAPDPEREGFTMAGDAYRGSLDAPIVVIEYSDYQCPFCRRHTESTQPVLDEKFVDTGQVRWVFRHFPLNIHPQAPAAGVAAECAGEQGQFWEMHELLFEDVASWSISEPNPRFTELATELDLDTDEFSTCLVDESMMERINSDFADGRAFVQGTPTFIVMHEGQGRLIPGALPADTFTQAIQQVIDSAQ